MLCIVGTFLTRSGFTSSIHTFVVSSVGWWFIGYIAIVATVAIVVIVRNLDQLRSPHRIDSLVSREATFLFNNLLFVALAFAILWGVLFPSISEALAGHRVATQSPYYDFFAVVLGLPLLLLAGIGPVVAWRRASLRGVVQAFRWPFVSALAAGALPWSCWATPRALPAWSRSASACSSPSRSVLELARGTAARRALTPGDVVARRAGAARGPQPQALRRLRRAPGGRDRHRRDRRHERVRDQPHDRAGSGEDGPVPRLRAAPAGHRVADHAQLHLDRGRDRRLRRVATDIDTLRPSARTYLDSGEPTKQIAIRPLLHTGEDLYLVFDGSPRPGEVTIKAFLNPLVNLLWLSAIVLVLGFAIAIWPDPRLAARLARRTNEAFARAR